MTKYETPSLFDQQTDGASESAAPQSELREMIDAQAAESRQAYLASRGGHEYDPNARRAAQTEGAGGGISEAVDGTLNHVAEADTRVLRVGDFYNGAPIKNDRDLERANATQQARRVIAGKQSISHTGAVQKERNATGAAAARQAVAKHTPQPFARDRSHIINEGDNVPFVPSADEEGNPIGSR